jgi:flagellar protein FlgJ
MQAAAASNTLYNDFGALASLKAQAQQAPDAALAEVAGQFEALFVQMMLRAMREATPRSDLFASHAMESYEQMYDQQLSLQLGRDGGIGLRDLLVQQLGGEGADADADEAGAFRRLLDYRASALPTPAAASLADPAPQPAAWQPATPREFAETLLPFAQQAAQALGTSPDVLLAQAALETGWGRHVVSGTRGSSNNFFNIKAGADWDGAVVQVATLEYRDGIAQREPARFRAYASAADSFADYVQFIRGSARYGEALAVAGDPAAYLEALQRAGYATDPAYADKVLGLLQRADSPWAGADLKKIAPAPLTGVEDLADSKGVLAHRVRGGEEQGIAR